MSCIKTKPGADADTDHELLSGNIKWKLRSLKRQQQQQQPRWNIDALKCKELAHVYAVEVGNRFETLKKTWNR